MGVWAKGSELAKLDGTGAARLKAGILCWSSFEAGSFKEEATFEVKKLEMVELMALSSGEAPLTKESEGRCRLRLVGSGVWVLGVGHGCLPPWCVQPTSFRDAGPH